MASLNASQPRGTRIEVGSEADQVRPTAKTEASNDVMGLSGCFWGRGRLQRRGHASPELAVILSTRTAGKRHHVGLDWRRPPRLRPLADPTREVGASVLSEADALRDLLPERLWTPTVASIAPCPFQ